MLLLCRAPVVRPRGPVTRPSTRARHVVTASGSATSVQVREACQTLTLVESSVATPQAAREWARQPCNTSRSNLASAFETQPKGVG
jgi:hypothetical protein